MRKILAIDPGYDRIGLAVLEEQIGGNPILLFSECFVTNRKDVHEKRLGSIANEVKKLVEEFKPDTIAIEGLFFSVNKKTAMFVAEARGAILSEVARKSIPVFEYKPVSIKVAVTGYGKSDKNQMMRMVPLLIKTVNKKPQDDEYDAIAIGLTYFATEKR